MKVVRQAGRRAAASAPKPGLTLYSSSHTCASRRELCVIVSWPSGDPYGRLFRKMCPTLEQGMMNSLPPHIQIWSEAEHMLIVPTVLRGQYMAFMRLTSTKQESYQNKVKVRILKLSVFMIKKKQNPKNNVTFIYSPVSKTVFPDMF